MIATLRRWWQTRTLHQQRVVAAAMLLLAALLYLLFIYAVDGARQRLKSTVLELRAQAAIVDQQASEYERLKSAPRVVVSSADLPVLIQAQAGAAGLTRGLQRVEAKETNRVMTSFGAVAFGDWLDWAASLQSMQIRLESCRVEAMAESGLVTVVATFVRVAP